MTQITINIPNEDFCMELGSSCEFLDAEESYCKHFNKDLIIENITYLNCLKCLACLELSKKNNE